MRRVILRRSVRTSSSAPSLRAAAAEAAPTIAGAHRAPAQQEAQSRGGPQNPALRRIAHGRRRKGDMETRWDSSPRSRASPTRWSRCPNAASAVSARRSGKRFAVVELCRSRRGALGSVSERGEIDFSGIAQARDRTGHGRSLRTSFALDVKLQHCCDEFQTTRRQWACSRLVEAGDRRRRTVFLVGDPCSRLPLPRAQVALFLRAGTGAGDSRSWPRARDQFRAGGAGVAGSTEFRGSGAAEDFTRAAGTLRNRTHHPPSGNAVEGHRSWARTDAARARDGKGGRAPPERRSPPTRGDFRIRCATARPATHCSAMKAEDAASRGNRALRGRQVPGSAGARRGAFAIRPIASPARATERALVRSARRFLAPAARCIGGRARTVGRCSGRARMETLSERAGAAPRFERAPWPFWSGGCARASGAVICGSHWGGRVRGAGSGPRDARPSSTS